MRDIRMLRLETTDPYRNLAIEEFLLRHTRGEYVLLWRNRPTVVVGRNQNAHAEVRLSRLEETNTLLARRITGGGAVYHDLGNINFSVIGSDTAKSFAAVTEPIRRALSDMGIACELTGRNDLCVDGRKISGNARFASDGRLLHHGTLLFDTDLGALEGLLVGNEEKLRAHAVRSVSSRVTNLRPLLTEEWDCEGFLEELEARLWRLLDARPTELPTDERIEELCRRNASREWLYPEREFLSDYATVRKKRYSCGEIEARLEMHGEEIRSLALLGDFLGERPIGELEERLIGCDRARAARVLAEHDPAAFLTDMTAQELLDLLYR